MALFNFKKKKNTNSLQDGISLYESGSLNESARIFMSLAEKGDVEACYWLGRILYEDGIRYSNEENLTSAKSYLEYASNNGHVQAQQLLLAFNAPQESAGGYYDNYAPNAQDPQPGSDPYNYMNPTPAQDNATPDMGGFGQTPYGSDDSDQSEETQALDNPFGSFGQNASDEGDTTQAMDNPFGPSGFDPFGTDSMDGEDKTQPMANPYGPFDPNAALNDAADEPTEDAPFMPGSFDPYGSNAQNDDSTLAMDKGFNPYAPSVEDDGSESTQALNPDPAHPNFSGGFGDENDNDHFDSEFDALEDAPTVRIESPKIPLGKEWDTSASSDENSTNATEPVASPFASDEWQNSTPAPNMTPAEDLSAFADDDDGSSETIPLDDPGATTTVSLDQPIANAWQNIDDDGGSITLPLNTDEKLEDDDEGHTISWGNRYSSDMEQLQLQSATRMAESGDFSGALNIWRKMSRNGSFAAQDEIGTCYRYGYGVNQSFDRAIFSYGFAADNHYLPAMLHLADLYENDLGDPTSAAKWFERAAAEGDSSSAFQAAEFYANQMQDYGKALPLYQQAYDSGNTLAASRLGRMFLYGLGVAANYENAFSLCLRSACVLDLEALEMMGTIYEKGYGVAASRKQAILYNTLGKKFGLSSADQTLDRLDGTAYIGTDLLPLSLHYALQDHPDNASEEALALLPASITAWETLRAEKAARAAAVQALLDRVHEIEKDRADSERRATRNAYQLTRAESAFAKGDYKTSFRLWSELSGEEGMGAAQNALGKCYADGLGTEKDLGRALYWYNEAAKNDVTEAMTSAGLLEFKLNKDYSQAYNWLARSAAREDVKGMCALADILSNPESGYTDFASAVSLYEKAAAKNAPAAFSGLGVLYLTGRGISRDVKKAYDCFITAALKLDQTALLYLGLLFEQGFEPIVSADPAEAALYYALAGRFGMNTTARLQKLNAASCAGTALLPKTLEAAIDENPEAASLDALKAYEASKLAVLKLDEED